MRARFLAIVMLLSVGAGACGESLEGRFDADLFRAGCARCHDADGSGGIGPAIGTADSNAALNLTDDMIRGVIRIGPGRMPAFGQITDAQVDSLVTYLRALQRGEVAPIEK